MQRKNMLLKPLAAWLIVAGIVTIISIIYAVFVAHTVDVIVGILLMISCSLSLAGRSQRPVQCGDRQVGERDNIVRSMSVVLLARVLLIYLVLDLNYFGDIGRFQSLSSAQQTGLVLSILLIIFGDHRDRRSSGGHQEEGILPAIEGGAGERPAEGGHDEGQIRL